MVLDNFFSLSKFVKFLKEFTCVSYFIFFFFCTHRLLRLLMSEKIAAGRCENLLDDTVL